MLDSLEALVALADHGTMRRAALHLHVSQSAVSKRIANLEYTLGQELVEPDGRRVSLTPAALRVLEKARPLLGELKELFIEERAEATGTLKIDLSVSVLVSWGAEALSEIRKRMPKIEFQVGAYHASHSVERVRAGQSMLALVQGESTIAPDLSALPVYEQELVIIPSRLKRFQLSRQEQIPVLAIEEHTEAWKFTKKGLRAASSEWGFSIKVQERLQSFSAITRMAHMGFGHGLAPRGVAHVLGISDKQLIRFPDPGLSIPISLIGRRSTLTRPIVQKFYTELKGLEL